MAFQLTYHSKAATDIGRKDLLDIMETATTNNARLGITGCLLYHKGFFLQILEGEEKIVREMFERISLDKRNKQITLLSTDQSDFRIFKEWDMAYYQLPDRQLLSPEEDSIRQELLELAKKSGKHNFTLKVFWYNVRQLLTSEGYYRSHLSLDQN